jgi:hypothetical protein
MGWKMRFDISAYIFMAQVQSPMCKIIKGEAQISLTPEINNGHPMVPHLGDNLNLPIASKLEGLEIKNNTQDVFSK